MTWTGENLQDVTIATLGIVFESSSQLNQVKLASEKCSKTLSIDLRGSERKPDGEQSNK
jgi:hypothetical protein